MVHVPLDIGFMVPDNLCNKTASLCNQYYFVFFFRPLLVFSVIVRPTVS